MSTLKFITLYLWLVCIANLEFPNSTVNSIIAIICAFIATILFIVELLFVEEEK